MEGPECPRWALALLDGVCGCDTLVLWLLGCLRKLCIVLHLLAGVRDYRDWWGVVETMTEVLPSCGWILGAVKDF
jgi:hypothetical protein